MEDTLSEDSDIEEGPEYSLQLTFFGKNNSTI